MVRRDSSCRFARGVRSRLRIGYLADQLDQAVQLGLAVQRDEGIPIAAMLLAADIGGEPEAVVETVDGGIETVPRLIAERFPPCCPGCGTKVPKQLSEQMHCCGACGLELCRDVNAARNVLERALRAGGWKLSCCTPRLVEPGMEDLACKAVPRCSTGYGCSRPDGCQQRD